MPWAHALCSLDAGQWPGQLSPSPFHEGQSPGDLTAGRNLLPVPGEGLQGIHADTCRLPPASVICLGKEMNTWIPSGGWEGDLFTVSRFISLWFRSRDAPGAGQAQILPAGTQWSMTRDGSGDL